MIEVKTNILIKTGRLLQPFFETEGRTMGTLRPENFGRGEIDALNRKDFTGARKNRIPCYFKVNALKAIGRTRGDFCFVKNIAHILLYQKQYDSPYYSDFFAGFCSLLAASFASSFSRFFAVCFPYPLAADEKIFPKILNRFDIYYSFIVIYHNVKKLTRDTSTEDTSESDSVKTKTNYNRYIPIQVPTALAVSII